MAADAEKDKKATPKVPPSNGAGDAPPDRSAVKPTSETPPGADSEKKPPPRRRPPREKPLKVQLEDLFGGMSLMVMASGDEYCANVIATQAEPLAIAWSELATKNPRVEMILRSILEGSAWGNVIVITAATVIPIAAHHGLYPAGFPMPFSFGLGPPPSPEVDQEQQRRGDGGTPPPPPPGV